MIKTAKELATACENVAKNYKTLYVMGCFGAPMNAKNKDRYTRNHSYNQQTERTVKINSASADTFGFDCVNLIKGLLWGWSGDTGKTYGGAVYKDNGVPDINADRMINECSGVTSDFSNIQIGEVVWMSGHIGVYIGNGLAVECTPKWDDCVQITAVHNIGKKNGYNGRTWKKHGKLPYVTYEAYAEPKKPDYTIGMDYLQKGDQGEAVRALQILLIGRGYDCGKYGADGDFGNATDKALRKYQDAKGLEVDGCAGPATMSCLLGV